MQINWFIKLMLGCVLVSPVAATAMQGKDSSETAWLEELFKQMCIQEQLQIQRAAEEQTLAEELFAKGAEELLKNIIPEEHTYQEVLSEQSPSEKVTLLVDYTKQISDLLKQGIESAEAWETNEDKIGLLSFRIAEIIDFLIPSQLKTQQELAKLPETLANIVQVWELMSSAPLAQKASKESPSFMVAMRFCENVPEQAEQCMKKHFPGKPLPWKKPVSTKATGTESTQ